uniref:Uncharacterized protein n=1 Tax=Pseudocercospora musae TaxID=113226 RepID=D2X8R1_9PEZI|nr:unknown [Pseudocercospora musae]
MAESGRLRGSEMGIASCKRELRETMTALTEMCARNLTTNVALPPPPRTAKHSRKIFFNKDQPVNTLHLMELNQLYREESKVKNDLQDLILSKVADPDTSQPKPDLEGNATQRAIQQGPEVTTADYLLLAEARNLQLTQDVDRLAKGNNLTDFAATQSTMELRLHVRETLEDFFQEYGVPNSAESYMLTEALGISAQEMDDFFKDKKSILGRALNAEEMLQMKRLLRNVQSQGRLEQMQQKARDQDIAVSDLK